jgi:hypothetical protein
VGTSIGVPFLFPPCFFHFRIPLSISAWLSPIYFFIKIHISLIFNPKIAHHFPGTNFGISAAYQNPNIWTRSLQQHY